MLRIEGLSKSFGGITAVDDVDINIKPNTITALIGPNGSGKTTVFNCCSGLVEIDRGKIWLDTIELTMLPAYQRANLGLSRTFQLLRVFHHLTVEENLRIALQQDDSSILSSLLGGHRDDKPHYHRVHQELVFWGLDAVANMPAEACSFGQQKLIGLARALLMPHRIVLLDEPVAGVNQRLRKELSGLLKILKSRGETLFIIEHDMDFVMSVADHVIVMNEGRVFRQGPPSVIQSDKEVLAIYLGTTQNTSYG